MAGLRGEESIAALCRWEGIAESLYYKWSKEFLEARTGDFESLKTVKLYSTAQVAEAASMVAGIPYTPATG